MKNKRFLGTFITAILASLVAVIVYATVFQPTTEKLVPVPSEQTMLYANLPINPGAGAVDFTFAAEKTVHSVVHVKTKSTSRDDYANNPLYEFFFGEKGNMPPRPVMGFGSGVIISDDGYIVTNNHVIDKMDEVEIVLNDRRSFKGELVAADPNTDIALLKIKAENLPYLTYGNSDDLKLGQWVLAVGNPYNLTSTVTAGIVSAKGRGLGIMNERTQFPIESFIQTDAAVNPGNSGGALVNIAGELVGINTAIASQTGAYSGNSFAVPVSIVKKIVSDLMEFGVVQRAFLGVTIQDVTQELANEHNIKNVRGVYINGLRDDGAAKVEGIKEGDIILSVNNVPVNSVSQLQEQISLYRPNDKINLLIESSGKEKQFKVTLRNLEGNTEAVKKDAAVSILGATYAPITDKDRKDLNIRNGVKIATLKSGKLMKAGIKEGFIITRINNKSVTNVDELNSIISATRGGVYVEGIYPDGQIAYYAFGL